MQYPYIHINMIANLCLVLVSGNVDRNLVYYEHIPFEGSSQVRDPTATIVGNMGTTSG